MRLRMTLALGAALAAAGAARAQGSYGMAPVGEQKLPDPPALEIEQKLGAQVPTDLTFRDEHNNPVRLGDLIGGKPAVLVLAYYRCPQLCNQVLNGVVDAMRKIPLDVGADYTVITVSFDPKEKPPLAWEKKHNYVREYGRPGA
ncbi:MAG TPA: SCO family protein, partial [Gemmataceae bacterium]